MKLTDLKEGDILTKEQWEEIYNGLGCCYRIVTVPLINQEEYEPMLMRVGLGDFIADIPECTYSYCVIKKIYDVSSGEHKEVKNAERKQFFISL